MERTIRKIVSPVQEAPKLTRVAAYARVSSGKDAMLHSLSAQVSYYNDLIQRYPGWVFCGVYADEALTGTKADRENFIRLLQDCKAGKVDMVITKSISRFARNTVTLLETVRELKLIGVDVYFEEQNIHSISADGELIPATLDRHTGIPSHMHYKRRVAGYARVSTDSEEQLTSYEAQVDYYTQYIKANPEWQFVAVYTDEGISATNTKHRDGFNRMVQDALDGKIDLIVTKSVSRFARNTVDSLTTVRKLKEKGVEVYFQKENIYTLDSKGELLITIMSSLAQEESRSISENVTWGQRKRFADGKVSMPYRHFLGYRKGADGLPEIVPEEAELVRRIYKLFMQGKTPHAIGKILTAEGIPTPAGKEKWQSSTIESILQNEKYRGDARLQKKFTVDFLQKKMKVNEGEVPQYYVENSHPAIIDPEEWDLVQAEFSRRKALGSRYSAASVFSSMIFCGDCGSVYGSKVWHSTDKYRRIIWQCNNKFKGNHHCTTPHLYEKDIKDMFLRAFGKLMADREHILEDIQLVQAALCDCTELDTQQAALADEMEIVGELIRQCIEENTIKVQNQEEYMERYERHTRRYEKTKKRYEAIEAERQRRKEQNDRISAFSAMLAGQSEMPIEFNDDLWLAAVDHATVNADETVTFTFKSGIEITEQM